MTNNEMNIALAAILTTALETEPGPFPQSMAYLALGSDIAKWETVKTVLTVGKLADLEGNQIVLTAKGREIAAKCNAYATA